MVSPNVKGAAVAKPTMGWAPNGTQPCTSVKPSPLRATCHGLSWASWTRCGLQPTPCLRALESRTMARRLVRCPKPKTQGPGYRIWQSSRRGRPKRRTSSSHHGWRSNSRSATTPQPPTGVRAGRMRDRKWIAGHYMHGRGLQCDRPVRGSAASPSEPRWPRSHRCALGSFGIRIQRRPPEVRNQVALRRCQCRFRRSFSVGCRRDRVAGRIGRRTRAPEQDDCSGSAESLHTCRSRSWTRAPNLAKPASN